MLPVELGLSAGVIDGTGNEVITGDADSIDDGLTEALGSFVMLTDPEELSV